MKKLPILFSFIMGLMMLTTSCEKWPFDWDNGGGGSTTSTTSGNTTKGGGGNQNCVTYGTLVNVPCGISDLGNMWILGDDGQYYQPCDASVIHVQDFEMPLEPGTRVLFGFKPMQGPSICDDEGKILCPPPGFPAKTRIALTCIQPIMKDTSLGICKPIVMTDNNYKMVNGNAEIISASRSGDCITMVIECRSSIPVSPSDINLKWIKGLISKSNPPVATLFLDDVPYQETASRVQRVTLNFSVAALTQIYPNVIINIEGWGSDL